MGTGLPFFYLHFYLFKEDRMKKVAVIMGSDSDWPVVKGACQQLETFGIPYEAHILSAHRTPAAAADFAKNARKNANVENTCL